MGRERGKRVVKVLSGMTRKLSLKRWLLCKVLKEGVCAQVIWGQTVLAEDRPLRALWRGHSILEKKPQSQLAGFLC